MKVHIHANCQAFPIAHMLKEVYEDWTVTYYEAHADKIVNEISTYYENVRSADIVLTQPIHAGFRGRDDLSVDWVKANARRDAAVLVFPSMHFAAHQPSWEMNPRPGFDLLAAHFLATGLSPQATLECMMSPDLLTEADIEREINAAIDEASRREIEDHIDICYSPYLQEKGYSQLLCHFSNHPLRETTAWVTNAILARLGYSGRVTVDGIDYQNAEHIAPLPTVTRFLFGNGARINPGLYEEVRLFGRPPMTVSQYYTDIITQLCSMSPTELRSDVGERWPTIQLLRRLTANGSMINEIKMWSS